MIEGKVYKGIEYIQIGDLPLKDQLAIREWLTLDKIIKIQTDRELLTECIQYKDYKYWFENILIAEESSEMVVKPNSTSAIKKFGLAIVTNPKHQ